MSNRTYRVTEIVGTSPDGVTEAIENAYVLYFECRKPD